MGIYTNSVAIQIGEVARLKFNDVIDTGNAITTNSADLVMHYEFLKVLHQTIGDTITKHEQNLKQQLEDNKKMN